MSSHQDDEELVKMFRKSDKSMFMLATCDIDLLVEMEGNLNKTNNSETLQKYY